MRITKKILGSQVRLLNQLTGRPVDMFQSKVGESTRFSTNHIALDKDVTGYRLEEQMGKLGNVCTITGRMSAKEMNLYLCGMLKGIELKG